MRSLLSQRHVLLKASAGALNWNKTRNALYLALKAQNTPPRFENRTSVSWIVRHQTLSVTEFTTCRT